MNLKPLGDRVVIEQDESIDRTQGGIILPDNAKEKPTMGKVLAVGPGKLSDKGNIIPMTVKTGDKVYYERYGGSEVEVGKQKVVVVKESEILAIINEEA